MVAMDMQSMERNGESSRKNGLKRVTNIIGRLDV